MQGTEMQKRPREVRAKRLEGLPRFPGECNFNEKMGSKYISENMAISILSKIAFLERRLENKGGLFKKELKSFVISLFEAGNAKVVEYGDAKEREFLTAIPYVRVSVQDSPDDRDRNLEILATFCIEDARSDFHFLLNMKRKFFQGIDVSETEANALLDMESKKDYSRYFNMVE